MSVADQIQRIQNERDLSFDEIQRRGGDVLDGKLASLKTSIHDLVSVVGMSAKDSMTGYVTNGCIGFYDGICNGGYGLKDFNGTATWGDLSGNDNHLDSGTSITGNWNNLSSTGKTGYWYRFPLAMSQAINKKAFTVEIVFALNPWNSSYRYFMGTQNYYSSTSAGFFLIHRYSRNSNTFYCGSNNKQMSISKLIADTNVHSMSFAISASGTSNLKGVCYLDGTSKTPTTSTFAAGTLSATQYYYLGGINNINTTYKGYCFNGGMYCVRFYNRTLSTTEITQNWQRDRTRFKIGMVSMVRPPTNPVVEDEEDDSLSESESESTND